MRKLIAIIQPPIEHGPNPLQDFPGFKERVPGQMRGAGGMGPVLLSG